MGDLLNPKSLPPIDLSAASTLEAVLAAIEVCRNPALRLTKTPVSLVQEMCMKMRIAPVYETDIKNHDLSHKPVFVCRAAMGQFEARAEGPNKKRAKHLSAVELLIELREGAYLYGNEYLAKHVDELVSLVSQMKENEEIDEQERLFKQNVLGELIELTLKKNMVAPLIVEEAQAPDGRFVFSGKLQDYEDIGYGPSKKEAKRDVATKLLNHLKQRLGPSAVAAVSRHRQHLDSVSFNDDPTINGVDSSLLTSNDARERTNASLYKQLKDSENPSIRILLSNRLEMIRNLSEFTAKLLKEEKLQFVYYNFMNKDGSKDDNNIVLRVEAEPQPICFSGFGFNRSDAILHANTQLLSYLQCLCSR